MATQTDVLVSPEAYLARERAAELEKSEYRDGEIVPMSGASYIHGLIVANIVFELKKQLADRDCAVIPNDLRVHAGAADLFTYPDVVVVCGTPDFIDKQFDTLLNPALLLEVLSPSTQDYDRGEKFARYRTLDSLQEYVLVSQKEAHVEHYARQPGNQWLLTDVRGLAERVELLSLDAGLDLAAVYQKVADRFRP